MPKLSEANIGDTVTLSGKVVKRQGTLVYIDDGGTGLLGISATRNCEIIPKPWEPKVGDEVQHVARAHMYPSSRYNLTLLHIHFDPEDKGQRKWATVAYKGDMPDSIYYEDLRPCAA